MGAPGDPLLRTLIAAMAPNSNPDLNSNPDQSPNTGLNLNKCLSYDPDRCPKTCLWSGNA